MPVEIVFVVGGPYMGKTELCERAVSELNKIWHIDMAKLLKEEVAKGTNESQEIKMAMHAGDLVHHGITTRLLVHRIKNLFRPAMNKFLISGYPRLALEVANLMEIMDKSKWCEGPATIKGIIHLDAAFWVAPQRILDHSVSKEGAPTIREICNFPKRHDMYYDELVEILQLLVTQFQAKSIKVGSASGEFFGWTAFRQAVLEAWDEPHRMRETRERYRQMCRQQGRPTEGIYDRYFDPIFRDGDLRTYGPIDRVGELMPEDDVEVGNDAPSKAPVAPSTPSEPATEWETLPKRPTTPPSQSAY